MLYDCKIVRDKNFFRTKNIIFEYYKNSKYFKQISELISEIYLFETDSLVDFNINLIKKICDLLNIKCNFYLASKDFNFKDNLSNAVYYNKISDYLNSTIYCTFFTGYQKGLYKASDFKSNNKKFYVQNYKHPTYLRNYVSKNYLSIIDLLFNDLNNSKKVILSGTNWIKYES